MTRQEIVQALRCISTVCRATDRDCLKCGYFRKWFGCDVDRLSTDAADLIERLTAENAALKKEIRKAGCMFCARFGDCPEGFKPTGQEDCDNCAKKPDCACMKCSGIGSSTDNWEWRGAPEAHNGKENS